jgi:uncharacterized protein (DUF885 family)
MAIRAAPAVEEHLPRRAKPPAPGVRPSALPAYGERLGVPARSDADRQFDQIVDEFLLFHFRHQPVRATNVGIHDFDAGLPATDTVGFETSISDLDGFLARLAKLDVNFLGRERRFDHAMLTSYLRGALLDLGTIQTWRRDPNFYISIVSGGIHALLKRDFAPFEDRAWNVVARLTGIPRVLRDARVNLENPPRVYTEIAIVQAAGLVHFLGTLVPVQMASIRDPVLREEFDHHLASVVGAANDFHDWLKTDLLPRSNGDFSLGADTYAKKLLYDERVATPLDSLFRRGEAALHETQRRMEQEASAIEMGISVREALARLARDAPSARDLVPATEAGLDTIRRFLIEHEILTPPETEDLRVGETPAFRRALSFASMDSPGVLETRATEAYYYVTPPDSTWPAARQAEHLGFYNPVQLEVVSIHEALPGHYYQFLALKQCPSLVRSLFGSGSNSEGWAHYCEEMMIEEGYGGGDPRYRLAQLNLALQRICRYLMGISLHTRGATYEEAVTFFEEEAYMARVNAEREARRGTSDPTYLVYTLGKWEILDLRADVRRESGAGFQLREFHDRFLTYGRAPIALIRDDWREPE